MKTIPFILQRPALLGLLASAFTLGSSAITLAQQPTPAVPTVPGVSAVPTAPTVPTVPGKPAAPTLATPAAEIENSDPFTKNAATIAARASQGPPTADQLDAQARILFARNETEAAIALQTQAVELAQQTLDRCTANLARYQGTPVDGGPIGKKLRAIIIPSINFQDVSLDEAVEYLRLKCLELDGTEKDPAKKGVNFVVGPLDGDPFAAASANPESKEKGSGPRIKSLVLRNVSAADVLSHVCRTTSTSFKFEDGAVTIYR